MKTAEQEKLEGNPGHRPEQKNPANKIIEVPAPPKYLDRIGARAYYDLTGLLGQSGMQVFAKSDYFALSMICDAYDEYRTARKAVITDGRYQTTSAGLKKRHPAIGDAQDAWKRVMSGLTRFGLTPVDRKNVDKILITTEESREERLKRRRAESALKAQKLAEEQKHIKAV